MTENSCLFSSVSILTFEHARGKIKRDLEPEVSNNTEWPDGSRKAGISPRCHSSHFILSCRSTHKCPGAHDWDLKLCRFHPVYLFSCWHSHILWELSNSQRKHFEVWLVPLFLGFPGLELEIALLGKLFSSAAWGTMALLFILRCGAEKDGPVRPVSCRTNTGINVPEAQVEKRLVSLGGCSSCQKHSGKSICLVIRF